MIKTRTLLILLVLCSLLSLLVYAYREASRNLDEILATPIIPTHVHALAQVSIQGEAEWRFDGVWQAAGLLNTLLEEDALRTGKDSQASLSFFNNAGQLTLDENTEITLDTLRGGSAANGTIHITLHSGQTRHEIGNIEMYEVRAGTWIIMARDALFTIRLDADQIEVVVQAGMVSVMGGSVVQRITAGEQISGALNEAPQEPRLIPSATPTPTATFTASPTPTFTASPTNTATATQTSTATLTPSSTPTSTLTASRTPEPSNTPVQVAESPTLTLTSIPVTNTATTRPTHTLTATPASSPTMTSTSAPCIATVNNASNINVRSLPTTSSVRIGTLAPDQAVQVIGKSPDDAWLQIEYGDRLGWVSRNFMLLASNCVNIPTVE